MNPTTPIETVPPAVILCVDDEPNILSSLQRLLRRHGYKVLTAESGAAGLALLSTEVVDLVISDMRMPQMDGAHFLEQVREHWPETMRVLLTGYADVESTMAAINKGEIYRYIAKPWDDNDVLLLVQHALAHKGLLKEKNRLEALTKQQNEELKTLNASLEIKVQERTAALRKVLHDLENSNDQLRKNFLTSVSIFSNLMELRAGGIGGHSRRVADLARKLAVQMGLKSEEIQDVVLAGLLHDIGKIGLPDSLLHKPFPSLTQSEREEVSRHPLIAQTALMPLEKLTNAAEIISAHHEHFDGTGYPNGLSGFAIPLGARILQVANDYDGAIYGTLLNARLTPMKAYTYIAESRGNRYDPSVVDAFKALLSGAQAHQDVALEMRSTQLRSGMVLAKDLVGNDGLLLLGHDHVLNDALIAQMIHFEHVEGYALTFWIKPPATKP
ncbi:MAG: HD domain-containing phosphohydrolase [Gallionellaceae bacterium]